MNLIKVMDLKEGDVFSLRGSEKRNTFISYSDSNFGVRIISYRDENGKEWHRKKLPFSKVKILNK
jgi:hypothetical protein